MENQTEDSAAYQNSLTFWSGFGGSWSPGGHGFPFTTSGESNVPGCTPPGKNSNDDPVECVTWDVVCSDILDVEMQAIHSENATINSNEEMQRANAVLDANVEMPVTVGGDMNIATDMNVTSGNNVEAQAVDNIAPDIVESAMNMANEAVLLYEDISE